MTDLTEYGDVMLDGVDEWGFRKIDGLLEDGTKIIIIGIGVIDKSFSEVGAGSEVFGIPFKALPFSDAGQGVDAFNTPFRTMGFSDLGNGMDVFALLRMLAFSDVGSGADAFTKEILGAILKAFSDVGLGADAFLIPFKAMKFSDIGLGSDVFVIPFKAMKFSDAGLGSDAFSKWIWAVILKTFSDVGLGADVWRGANLIEAPLVIITVDGKIILRISRATKKEPDYILLG